MTREFNEGQDNSDAVARWIAATPEAVAFSTHTARGPVPAVEGTRIVTVMLLRDPLERIRSAYRFERTQQADTWGANLAKEFPFAGYVRARLAHPQDRQCRNFQTWRLASMVPGEAPRLERAKQGARQLDVLGLVERFDATLDRLAATLAGPFPDFARDTVRANTTKQTGEVDRSMAESPQLTQRLRTANADDLALLDWVRNTM